MLGYTTRCGKRVFAREPIVTIDQGCVLIRVKGFGLVLFFAYRPSSRHTEAFWSPDFPRIATVTTCVSDEASRIAQP